MAAPAATGTANGMRKSVSFLPTARISMGIIMFLFVFAAIATGAGAVYAYTRDSGGPSGAMCQDALTRRQHAESALTAGPQAAGNADAQALANVKWDEARKDANRLFDSAQSDVRRFCS